MEQNSAKEMASAASTGRQVASDLLENAVHHDGGDVLAAPGRRGKGQRRGRGRARGAAQYGVDEPAPKVPRLSTASQEQSGRVKTEANSGEEETVPSLPSSGCSSAPTLAAKIRQPRAAPDTLSLLEPASSDDEPPGERQITAHSQQVGAKSQQVRVKQDKQEYHQVSFKDNKDFFLGSLSDSIWQSDDE